MIMNIIRNEILIPNDMADTITKLNQALYGDDDETETESTDETEMTE